MAADQDAASPNSGPTLAALSRTWLQRALLTQEQLAQRTGSSVRTISRLEAGGLYPRGGSPLSTSSEADRAAESFELRGRERKFPG